MAIQRKGISHRTAAIGSPAQSSRAPGDELNAYAYLQSTALGGAVASQGEQLVGGHGGERLRAVGGDDVGLDTLFDLDLAGGVDRGLGLAPLGAAWRCDRRCP